MKKLNTMTKKAKGEAFETKSDEQLKNQFWTVTVQDAENNDASAILIAGGADLSDFTISQSQVHWQRDQVMTVLAEGAMLEFQDT